MAKFINIHQQRLTGETIAICLDAYAPAHRGHLKTIIEAKRQHDGALVIVSGADEPTHTINGLTLNNCFRSMRELFSDDELVSVDALDTAGFMDLEKTSGSAYSEAWGEACKALLTRNLAKNAGKNLVWYVSDDYVALIEAHFPESEIHIVTNDLADVSTANIIANPYKNWDYIMQPFRKYFSNNFLVFGTASTGKTNLVRDIARMLNAPYTDEYARRYEYIYNVRDNELRVADLHNMGVGQFNNNRDAITNPSNRGIMIADTDTMVTKCYAKQYLKPDEFSEVEEIFDYYIAKQKWALIFVIPPTTAYVDDGFRDMKHADAQLRDAMQEMFLAELEQQKLMDKVRILESDTFFGRYQEMLKYMNEYMQETYDSTLIYE